MRFVIAVSLTVFTAISKIVASLASLSSFIVFWLAVFGVAPWNIFFILLITFVIAVVMFIVLYVTTKVTIKKL